MPRYSLRALFLMVAIVAGLLLLGQGFIAWIESHARTPSRRSNCVNNLKQIGIALHTYRDVHGVFPPAYATDANGKPMHSWRVLLLPYFEDEDSHVLYQQYDLSEPWNDPNNRQLAEAMLAVYRGPSSKAPVGETCYVAIVGPKTGWPHSRGRGVMEFRDGLSNTMALTEIADSGIHWLEPRDLTFGEATDGVNPPLVKLSVSSPHPGGANVLFFDGSVLFLESDLPPETLRAYLTANGGESVPPP